MYIRRTHTTNSAAGERYTTHRLVQSERVGGRVRQVTLLNLGRQFTLPQEEWPARCARLDALRSGQGAVLAGSGPVEREAQRLFARLLARQGVAPPLAGRTDGGDVQAVDVDSLELSRPRSAGVESVALWAMAEVRFVALLEHLGLSGPQRALIVGAIIWRMAAPGSERATHRWLSARSALGELLEVDPCGDGKANSNAPLTQGCNPVTRKVLRVRDRYLPRARSGGQTIRRGGGPTAAPAAWPRGTPSTSRSNHGQGQPPPLVSARLAVAGNLRGRHARGPGLQVRQYPRNGLGQPLHRPRRWDRD
ncbi:hypothetical protein [uncultured Lamprocystis sp.]|uniref:hypothetical protein n=1 Tax=uncultured Lamprocystis sp. TaxID=543132 RepID=UPI0025EB9CA0|nr:hypothetical protein [uncultured Lamprocystis sp.]